MKYIKLFENQNDITKLYHFCMKNLKLKNAELGKEYYYQSITSCVIDAVFSIGISYEQTRKAVERYNEYYDLKLFRDSDNYPSISEQDSLEDLIQRTEEETPQQMAIKVYQNRCRTATHGAKAVTKAEAVYLFAKTLNNFGINYFQDLQQFIGNEELESEIRKIPGQTTGISLDYFFMLAGDETFVKVDRMMIRFMIDAIGYSPDKYKIREMRDDNTSL